MESLKELESEKEAAAETLPEAYAEALAELDLQADEGAEATTPIESSSVTDSAVELKADHDS